MDYDGIASSYLMQSIHGLGCTESIKIQQNQALDFDGIWGS